MMQPGGQGVVCIIVGVLTFILYHAMHNGTVGALPDRGSRPAAETDHQ
jgi:hypothetical protein